MRAPSVFSPRLLAAWIGAALLTFAASLYFGGGGGGSAIGADTVGPSAFSRSAVGYAGIADILRRLNIPVEKNRRAALAEVGGGVLVVAEPPLQQAAALQPLLQARNLLLILPKWHGRASAQHRGWLAEAELAPEVEATAVLDFAVPGGKVSRVAAPPAWSANALRQAPNLEAPVQLVVSDRLTPIVGGADGMLLGERIDKGHRLWVLADPDVMENHGLGREGNAAFSVALFQALLGAGHLADGVVFDETVHGFVATPPSRFKLLFEFPFVVATGLGAFAVLLLLWATLGRFGAPQALPPPLDAGKRGLIENAASLLDFAGHQPVVVRRYVQASLRDVARRLHAPPDLADPALLDWLARVGEARGVGGDCRAIAASAERGGDASALTAVARAIHHWKGEILDGPSGDTYAHRRLARRGEEGRRRTG
jgi:hypothetical protein